MTDSDHEEFTLRALQAKDDTTALVYAQLATAAAAADIAYAIRGLPGWTEPT